MRRFYLLFFIFIVMFNRVNGQNIISASAYKTSRDFLLQQPYFKDAFSFTKYKRDSCIYKVVLRNESQNSMNMNTDLWGSLTSIDIWGLFDDTTLYLNCSRLEMKRGFVKVKELGKFAYIRGRPIKNRAQEHREIMNSILFGAVGGVLTELEINKQTKNKVHYVVNLETGVSNLLTKNYLLFILRDEKDFLEEFNKEPNQDSIDTYIRYIRLLNKRYPLNTLFK